MHTKPLALAFLVLVLLAAAGAGWKWGSSGHRSAGWTWDDGAAQYYWAE